MVADTFAELYEISLPGCNEMMDRLVERMAKSEGVTEQLKSDDWLCLLQKMNSIRSRAEEVVLHLDIFPLILRRNSRL